MARLPFSLDAFLDVFALYNRTFWPASLALWLATLAASIDLLRRYRQGIHSASARTVGAWTFGLLAIMWAWSAIAYHAWLFARINPAAYLFAAFFLLEAGLLAWCAVATDRLRLSVVKGGATAVAAFCLVFYGLLYPVLALPGHTYPRMPTFGVPCPTTIVTIGFLMLVGPVPSVVLVVPILWAAIGGSAAFLLGMWVDLALIAAAAAVLGLRLWRSIERAPLPV